MDTNRSSPRFRPRLAFALAAIVMSAALSAPAYASDVTTLGQFELDGNAVDTAAGLPDDWSNFLGNGAGGSEAHSGILQDYASPDYNFTGGGSKDVSDIGSWAYNAAKMTPDKDNITNAYAAAYIDASSGHLVFYFGADRFATNGDAQLGFWFFKNEVALKPLSGGNGKFIGVHHNDDTLVQVNFLQGGKTAQIGVFKWANGALLKIVENTVTNASGVPLICTSDHAACARTNISAAIPSPWPYTPKAGAADILPAQAFFEGGLDVTALVGGDLCFSSFMAETRSSQPFDSTLKDFVLGPLQTCSIGVDKVCSSTRPTTDAEFTSTGKLWASTYQARVFNTGGSGLPNTTSYAVVDDAGTPLDPSDDITQTFTGALSASGDHFFPEREFYTNVNGVLNGISAAAVFGSETLVAEPFSVECPSRELAGAIGVRKDCDASGVEFVPDNGKLVVKVSVEGEVCNDNPTGGLSMTIQSVTDYIGDDPLVPSQTIPLISVPYTLAPGDCRAYAHSYFPKVGHDSFSDTVKAVGTNARLSTPVEASDSATCLTCPAP